MNEHNGHQEVHDRAREQAHDQVQDPVHDRSKVLDTLRAKLSSLPEQPGCYLMKDSKGDIIYVGKAKVLRNRVRSYFVGSHNTKTQLLVNQIVDFEYIVTANDVEALILECNLIKEHSPHFNVLLKDDKTYPYIKITNERHPRLEITRRIVKDQAKYFGPYPNAYAAQQTKKLLDRLYPLRKCKALPNKVCLYYHMGQCLAPCEYEVEQESYEQMIAEITRFLKGGHEEIRAELEQKMHEEAAQLNFERAQEYRDHIISIDAVMQEQKITLAGSIDLDAIGFAVDKGMMCVQILYLRQGKMIERHAAVFPYFGEVYEDFATYVTQYYSEHPALPKEILISRGADEQSFKTTLAQWLKVKVHVPQRGKKRQLVKMAEDNAKIALQEHFKLLERDENKTTKAVANLGSWIGLSTVSRIEAFDNSNIQGTHPVSAMVVFIDGKPARKEYRKYRIRTVQGPDDYETMREVVRRRYERVLREDLPLPDLIIVDGGKGQIAGAVDVLENELGLYIPVCGLAKDTRHRTSQLLIGDPPEVVPIPRGSQEFYLLQRIQEEVHRFAVSFHRQLRTKSMVASRLDEIPGVGEVRRKRLMKHFGSLQKIKEADIADFKPLGIGEKLAHTIINWLKDDENG